MFYENNQNFKLTKPTKTMISDQISFWIMWWPWKGPIFIWWSWILIAMLVGASSKCPPLALIYDCSRFLSFRTAFLMSFFGKSVQIASSTIFNFNTFIDFNAKVWYLSSIATQICNLKGSRSGELSGHSSFLMNSGLFCLSHSCARPDMWAGAPYCWKTKLLLGTNLRKSSISLVSRLFTWYSALIFAFSATECGLSSTQEQFP